MSWSWQNTFCCGKTSQLLVNNAQERRSHWIRVLVNNAQERRSHWIRVLCLMALQIMLFAGAQSLSSVVCMRSSTPCAPDVGLVVPVLRRLRVGRLLRHEHGDAARPRHAHEVGFAHAQAPRLGARLVVPPRQPPQPHLSQSQNGVRLRAGIRTLATMFAAANRCRTPARSARAGRCSQRKRCLSGPVPSAKSVVRQQC